MEPTQAPQPIQWLKENAHKTKLCDTSLKFLSYTGRLALLCDVSLLGVLKSLSRFRNIFWGLNAVRDLYSVKGWIVDWQEKGEKGKLADRAHVLLIRVNFLTKTFLKGASLLIYSPHIVQVKATLGRASLFLVISMDAKLLFKAAVGKDKLSVEKGLGMGDDCLDLLNVAMDAELLPIPLSTDGFYVATGLASSTCSLFRQALKWPASALSHKFVSLDV